MKKVILVLTFMPVSLFGQISENFESGTIKGWSESISGHWKADSSGSISGKYSLHHIFDNPDAGIDQVGLQTKDLQPGSGLTKWSFKLRHGYDPSSSNNWGVFLTADNSPSSMMPGGNVSGYIIGVNLTGYDDTLRLWKIRNGALTVVLSTRINWQNNIGSVNPANICTERSQSGKWTVKVYSKNSVLADSSSAICSELFNCDWFGVFYRYSSTRDRLLWIDDIMIDGPFIEDKDPPEINKCIFDTYSSVELSLNEEPAPDFFTESNFAINDRSLNASGVIRSGITSARIFFKENFQNKIENTIYIKSMCDKSGNCRSDFPVKFTPAWAEPGDIIISEIMADPSPAVSLPEKEYIEIYNRTAFPLDLKKWKLSNDGSGSVFPEVVLKPDERMILCQLQDTAAFLKYGKVCGLKSFPALIDAGRLLVLYDSLAQMIHGVEYSSEWNNDNLKKNGGWSLEMIDTDFPFYFEGNWITSVSKTGGTPGSINAVNYINRDRYFGGIENVFPKDSMTLKVNFSEPVPDILEHCSLIKISGQLVGRIYSDDPLCRKIVVIPTVPFLRNVKYSLEISDGIKDFAGNNPAVAKFGFGLTEVPLKGEILFNELLFNPLPDDADFIELFNASSKILDASDLLVASVNDAGIHSETYRLSQDSRCILPGSYFAVTTKKGAVVRRYPASVASNIFQVSSLPSMPDDKGHLILYNRSLDVIDEVVYNEKMHFSLLSGHEGISLEKVRTLAPSNDPKNWYSASQTSSWGTPGGPNSISVTIPEDRREIVLSSTKITPDNDGFEDFLVIEFNPDDKGNVISVTVFDENGRFISKVAENVLSGPHTTIVWNGTAQDGSLVDSGIYIVFITAFEDSGRRATWKKVCTVIR